MKMRFSKSVLVFVVILIFPGIVLAQTSITLNGLSSDIEVGEGSDFATDELQNPQNMKELADIGWSEGMGNPEITVEGWKAINNAVGGYFFPLFGGFKETLPAEAPQGNTDSPRFGQFHPIDASKYNFLCYEANVQNPSSFAIYWENDRSKPTFWPDGSNFGSGADGWYTDSAFVARTGRQLRCFDMTKMSTVFEQKAGSWSGKILSLRIDPSLSAPVGSQTTVAGVRVVDPNSAYMINLSWNTSGPTTSGLRKVIANSTNSTNGGLVIAAFKSSNDPKILSFPSAALPPGDWYFYVQHQAYSANGTPQGAPVNSNVSARLRIQAKPIFQFTSPTEKTGEDYWTSLGNPIDMDGPSDVINMDPGVFPQVLRQWVSGSFPAYPDAQDGKIFQALAEPASLYPGQLESDSQVWLPVPRTHPIDPRYNCHFSIRAASDMSGFPSHAKAVEFGTVLRPAAWETDIMGVQSTDPGALVLYPGYAEYTVNLCKLSRVDRGLLWKDLKVARNFRVDPLETGVAGSGVSYNWFYIDWVKLTAENYAPNGSFEIRYTINDGSGLYQGLLDSAGSYQVSFYRDNDRSGFDGTLIGTQNGITLGNHSFTWNTNGLENGSRHYIYAVVTNGVTERKIYTPVEIIIGSYQGSLALTRKTRFDFDGDGRSDTMVLRRGAIATRTCRRLSRRSRRLTCTTTPARNGAVLANTSRDGFKSLSITPGNFLPIGPDIDGDAISDLGTVVNVSNNTMHWGIRRSSSNTDYFRVFGVPGDVPLVADWNGNDIDEITVFRNGEWYILNENEQVIYVRWGVPGDIASPADFDGDGRADLTVYRPSEGRWYVFSSKTGQLITDSFGLNGDIPVAADYDGDGRADFAIYRPSSGLWIIRPSGGGADIIRSWGLASDQPIPGLDFDGDGRPELTVYRPTEGNWYIFNLVTGQGVARQWGLFGDFAPK